MTFLFPSQTGSLLYVRAIEKRAGTSFGLALRAVVFDKGLNVIAVLVLIVIGQLLLDADHSLSHPVILFGAATPVFFFLFVNLQGVIRRLPAGWQKPRNWLDGLDIGMGTGRKVKLLALASLYQSTDIVSAVFAGFAVKGDADPITVLGIFPIILLLSYIPAAFQGFGTREALAVLWLGGAFSAAESATLGFLVSMMEYAVPAACGMVCIGFVLSALSPRTRSSAEDAQI
jgi:hypothetical protein